jgi:hypothetical protein
MGEELNIGNQITSVSAIKRLPGVNFQAFLFLFFVFFNLKKSSEAWKFRGILVQYIAIVSNSIVPIGTSG